MSEYKGIKGFQVQTRTSDPVPYAQALTDNPYAGTWGSGGALPQANRSMGVFGTYTSLVAAGGSVPTPSSTEADSYNGTAWSEITELSSAKNESMGFGNSASSGYIVKDTTENWNGSAWTEVNDLNVARGLASAAGTSSASLLAGGESGPGAADLVEQWNGTSWTEIAEINTDRQSGSAMSGTVTAAIVSAGYTGTAETANAETWNGSSWTEGNNINEARRRLGFSGTSVPTALIFGGAPGSPGPTTVSGKTESYDGTSWTEVNDMATARRSVGIGVAGTGTNALAVGGLTPTVTTSTEEWAFTGLDPSTTPAADYADAITGDFYYNSTTGQFKQINTGGAPIGTWASSGTTNSAHYSGAGISGPAGNTSVLIAGLNAAPYPAATEFWNGSSWTEVNDLNTGRYFANNMWGSNSAGAVAGGVAPSLSPANTTRHESWDGSSWTETTDMNNGEGGKSSSTNGPQSSAILAKNANAETWDGSSWTEVAEMNTSRTGHNGAGVSASSALIFLGAPNRDIAEEWNGSSWTEVSDLNNGREYAYGTGTTTDAMAAGGRTSPPVSLKTQTEHWNGSSWTEIADIATGRILAVGGGTSGSAMFATGQTTTNVTISEEFSADDFEIKTVTTS